MATEETRLECLKLAVEWGRRQYDKGYTGIGDEAVIERAARYAGFCDPLSKPRFQAPEPFEGETHQNYLLRLSGSFQRWANGDDA